MTKHNDDRSKFIQNSKQHCDEHINHFLKTSCTSLDKSNRLLEACKHSLFPGGKRIRPALVYAVDMCFNDGQNTHLLNPIAAAIECIHTYSLIHDDLPAMDDDDLRRGKATSHIQFDEATAILAGDTLLNNAFEILSDAHWALEPENKCKIIAYLARSSGPLGMLGGQMLDLLSEDQDDIGLSTIENIHLKKTGALLTASLVCSAIALQLPNDIIATLEKLGQHIGLAFQIADDILDVTQSSQTLGKPANSDLEQNKATYPKILGLDGAQDHLKKQEKHIMTILDTLPKHGGILKDLCLFLIQRNH